MSKVNLDSYVEKIIHDPLYDIREDGTIWSQAHSSWQHKWRRVGLQKNSYGYHTLNYWGRGLQVSRIIYRKFVGELDSTKIVDHKDGNIENNKSDNLQQITRADNIRRSKRAKINFEIAEEIRRKYREGVSSKDLGLEYKLTQNYITTIVRGKRWNSDVQS